MIHSISGAFRATALTVLYLAAAGISNPAEAAAEGYVIRGTVEGLADGTEVRLSKTTGDQIDAVGPKEAAASAMVKDGKFTLTGTVEYPQTYAVTFMVPLGPPDSRQVPYQPEFTLFLENAPIEVAVAMADLPKTFPAAFAGTPRYKRAKVKGSASHDQYLAYMASWQPLQDARQEVFTKEYVSYVRNRKNRPMADGTGIVTRIDEREAARNAFVGKFIREHGDDFVGLHVARLNVGNFPAQEIEPLLAGFSPRLRASPAWPLLRAEADRVKQSALGAKFVDLHFNDQDGNAVKLSDVAGKGRYVLLEFWASWCGPCRADIPHLKEAYAAFNPAGFEIVSISMDENKDAWLKALGEEKMPWRQMSDLKAFKGDVSKIYNFNGIPACVLVGPDGRIVDRNMRGSWMDRKLIELYGDKFPAVPSAQATPAP